MQTHYFMRYTPIQIEFNKKLVSAFALKVPAGRRFTVLKKKPLSSGFAGKKGVINKWIEHLNFGAYGCISNEMNSNLNRTLSGLSPTIGLDHGFVFNTHGFQEKSFQWEY
jgi:hypothetical protein